MKELSHADYEERIYNYTDNRAEQNVFLKRLHSGLVYTIMKVATGKLVDYHSFMDLLHGEWHFEDAYNYFKNEAIED